MEQSYAGKEVVTGDTQPWRKPFSVPGEIDEITFHSP